jgi:DNA invertase Pin-like site-specific DNA recombinase
MSGPNPRRSFGRQFVGRTYNGRTGPCRRTYYGRDDRTSAAPVHQHVLELLAGGISRAAIARAAGIGRTAVIRLLDESTAETSQATATAVLGVSP